MLIVGVRGPVYSSRHFMHGIGFLVVFFSMAVGTDDDTGLHLLADRLLREPVIDHSRDVHRLLSDVMEIETCGMGFTASYALALVALELVQPPA